MTRQLTIHTSGRGLFEITGEVQSAVGEAEVGEGLCTIVIQHTSASLVIQENADPVSYTHLTLPTSDLV